MKNQSGEVKYGRVDDNRSVPSSGSSDFNLRRQIGMGTQYELVDEPCNLRSDDISSGVGNDDEIRDFMNMQDDEFWLQFWRSFWKMFWMAFVMMVILYILLAII